MRGVLPVRVSVRVKVKSGLTIILLMIFPLLTMAQERDSVCTDSETSSMRELTVYGRRSEEIVPSQRLSGKRLEALS